jgi:hypothetical protein
MAIGKFHGAMTTVTPRLRQPQHLAAIELAVVDALGHVGIGFAPRLAAFVDLPRGQLEASPPHDARRREQILRALGRLGIAPRRKRGRGDGDGFLRLFGAGPPAAADDLFAVRGIDRIERRRRLDGLAFEDRRIGAAELRRNFGQGGIHRSPRLDAAEIRQRLDVEGRNIRAVGRTIMSFIRTQVFHHPPSPDSGPLANTSRQYAGMPSQAA